MTRKKGSRPMCLEKFPSLSSKQRKALQRQQQREAEEAKIQAAKSISATQQRVDNLQTLPIDNDSDSDYSTAELVKAASSLSLLDENAPSCLETYKALEAPAPTFSLEEIKTFTGLFSESPTTSSSFTFKFGLAPASELLAPVDRDEKKLVTSSSRTVGYHTDQDISTEKRVLRNTKPLYSVSKFKSVSGASPVQQLALSNINPLLKEKLPNIPNQKRKSRSGADFTASPSPLRFELTTSLTTSLGCASCKLIFESLSTAVAHWETGVCFLNLWAVNALAEDRDPKHTFTNKRQLDLVIEWSEKRQKKELKARMAAKYPTGKVHQFPCPSCTQNFETVENFNRHLMSPVHQAQPYKCPNCKDTSFSRASLLLRHVEEKPACKDMALRGTGNYAALKEFMDMVKTTSTQKSSRDW